MSVYFGGTIHVLTIKWVLYPTLNCYHDRLIHFIADHTALQCTDVFGFSHYAPAFSLSTVLTRAMFLRTCLNKLVWFSWPVAVCMRKLNCSRNRPSSS